MIGQRIAALRKNAHLSQAELARILGVSPRSAVTMESTLEDLGADSLDAVELIMALEEEYDLEFAEDEVKAMKSVKNIVDYIESHQ